MKNLVFTFSIVSFCAIFSCNSQQKTIQNTTEKQENTEEMTVMGKITKIENGKDGYTATILNDKGIVSVVVVSIVNLQKSGEKFKRFQIGDEITVTGSFWKDDEGIFHVMAQKFL